MTTPCARCVLRATSIRHLSSYGPISSTASPISPPHPCPVCLGILQDPSLEAVTAAIAAQLPRITHDNYFKINTTLPPAASLIRDRSFRIALSRGLLPLPHNLHPVSLREAVKWSLCERLNLHGVRYSPDAQLFLDVVYSHPETDRDTVFIGEWERTNGRATAKRSRQPSQSTTTVTRVVESMSDEQFLRAAPERTVPPPPIQVPVTANSTLSVSTLLLAGSYNKYSRIVSQTPWFTDNPSSHPAKAGVEEDEHGRTKRTECSVEQVVVKGICDILQPEKATFTAGGREDVDVRMLGGGRPFAVEVINPRIIPSLVTAQMVTKMAAISAKSSSAITIRGLRQVPKTYFTRMREFETEKRKHYRCVVWTHDKCSIEQLRQTLETEHGFLLKQKTPLRVLHRRTQAVRERMIYEAHVVRVVNEHFFVLDLVAQAGTYIKEFVHGDNGRTIPNVAQLLGCNADILQLDVTRISREGKESG